MRKDRDCLPPNSITSTSRLLNDSQHLQSGLQLLDRSIKPEDLLKTGILMPGLAHLQKVVNRRDPPAFSSDSTEEGVSFHKIQKGPLAAQSMKFKKTAGQILPIRKLEIQTVEARTIKVVTTGDLTPPTKKFHKTAIIDWMEVAEEEMGRARSIQKLLPRDPPPPTNEIYSIELTG